MATPDLKNAPYHDDFDPEKKFYRILYRPGLAVQARELTQVQTLLQEQVNRVGTHLFKEGAMVVPGHITFDRRFTWVKVQSNSFTDTEEAIVNNFLNKTIRGQTSLLEAQVIHYTPKDTNNIVYLFVKYQKGAVVAGENLTAFADGETLEVADTPAVTVPVDALDATGTGCGATIDQGIYFTKGFFAIVDKQILVVDTDSPNPSARIGLSVVQSIVKPEDDESLLDNATGAPNYAAPGAHRLKIELILTTFGLDTVSDPSVNDNFIELLRLVNGRAELKVNTTAYNIILDTLARRTFDESGDYTVRPFLVSAKEFYREDDNSGAYAKEDLFQPTDLLADQEARNRFGLTEDEFELPQIFAHTDISYGANKWLPGRTLAEFEEAARAKAVLAVEPGKAYVRGYEIETLGTTYVDVDKARDVAAFNNATVRPLIGNFTRITNVTGLPRISTGVSGEQSFQKVNLYNRRLGDGAATIIGTARAYYLEFTGGSPFSPNAAYSLYFFDVKMNEGKFFDQVMSIKSTPGLGLPNFSANTILRSWPFLGAYVSGTNGTNVLSGSNTYWATLDEQRLLSGDSIQLADGRILYVDQPPVSDDQLILNSPITGGNIVDQPMSLVYAELENVANVPLLFRTPQAFTKHLTSDTNFVVQKEFLSNLVNAGTHDVTIQTADATEEFLPFSIVDWVVVTADTGDFVPLNASILSVSGTQATFTFPDATYDGKKLVILASVLKTQHPASQHKIKNLVPGIFASAAVSPVGAQDLKRFYLGKCDVIRIKEIRMSADFSVAPIGSDPDISDRYDLDNGQRDTHYDHASIVLKKGAQKPTGRIAVVYDYYSHVGDGIKAYFSVDSYDPNEYASIPTYESTDIGASYPLSDVLDFRPTKAEAAPSVTYTDTDFLEGSGSITFIPKGIINIDFEHYLHRIDKLFLNPDGNFYVKQGTPGINPVSPSEPSSGMVLYDVMVRAYTKSVKEIFSTYRENKRYTMRDIGKLEKRIENIEYYTSLSLLEKQTTGLQITDADGNDRFKNGFIVDNFKGHGVGDVFNPDYTCAMDIPQGELRPQYFSDNVALVEAFGADGFTVPTTPLRTGAQYVKKGPLALLPYDHAVLVSQKAAGKNINVNPYAVFSFLGSIELTPSQDQWKDTDQKPELRVFDNSAFESLENLVADGALGTVWNEWEYNWVGTNKVNEEVISTQTEVFPGVAQHLDLSGNPDNIGLSWNQAGQNLIDQIKNPKKAQSRTKKSTNSKTKQETNLPKPNSWPVRVNETIRTTYETQINQTRSGYQLQVKDGGTIDNNLGDRVVDVSFAPIIRSRDIVFVARGFKPNARLFAFFDREAVSEWVSAGSSFNPTQTIDNAAFPLLTNNEGSVTGTFRIPDAATASSFGKRLIQFLTGERIFTLTDRPNNDENWTTQGAVVYRAQGLQETKQNTILSTRVADFDRAAIVDPNPKEIKFETYDTNVKTGAWVDPVAQSFLVNTRGGAFITKLSVYFATKDPNIPVTIQIREMVNGYPGSKILPFGEVTLSPSVVHTNAITGNHAPDADDPTDTVGTLSIDGGAPIANFTSNDFVPTVAEFSAPVYLLEGVEYCFVVMANTQGYNLWVSELGLRNVGTRIPITAQPYAGSLFKSQNASTWTADQNQDVMFELFQAEFDTTKVGTLTLVNENLAPVLLAANPLNVKTDSNLIRVSHPNHGFRNKDTGFINPPRVKISGVSGPVGGIPAADINNTGSNTDYHVIRVIDLDSYYLLPYTLDSDKIARGLGHPQGKVISRATNTTFGGGEVVFATEDKQMEVGMPMITDIVLPDTTVTYEIRTTSGSSVHDTDDLFDPYIMESNYSNFVPNKNIEFATPRAVLSLPNEINAGPGPVISSPPTIGSKSLFVRATLRTSNKNISPVIDLEKTSITCVASRLNFPAASGEFGINVPRLDETLSTNRSITGTITSVGTSVTISGGTFTSEVHNDAFITVTSGANSGQVRRIVSFAGANAVIDEAFSPDIAVAANANVSSSKNVSFGNSVLNLVSAIASAEFFSSQNFIRIDNSIDPVSAAKLSVLYATDYIVVSGTTSNNGTFKVERVNYTASGGIDVFVEEGLVDETPGATTIDRVVDSIKCNNAAQSLELSKARVGQSIQVTGAVASSGQNNGVYRIQDIVYSAPNIEIFVDANLTKEDAPVPVTLTLLESFFSEETPVGGSAASSYVTRRMILSNPSTALQIRYAAQVDQSAQLKVYYKVSTIDDNTPFDEIAYVEAIPDAEISPATHKYVFKEQQHTVNGLSPFLSVAVKLVFLGCDPTRVPRVKDLQVIALDE